MNEQYKALGVSDAVLTFGEGILAGLKDRFADIDAIAEANQLKVIAAMQKNRLARQPLQPSPPATATTTRAATIWSGSMPTASAPRRRWCAPRSPAAPTRWRVALGANLLPGDELLSPVGGPYDTLEEVIGIRPSAGSLKEYGVSYRQVDLLPGRRLRLRRHPRRHQREDQAHHHPALQGLRHPSQLLCGADRPAHRLLQAVQAGCDLHGGQLLRRVHRAAGAVQRRRGHDRGQPYQEPRRRPGPHRRLCLRHEADRIDRCACRLSAPGLGQEVGANLGLLTRAVSGLFPRPHRDGRRR